MLLGQEGYNGDDASVVAKGRHPQTGQPSEDVQGIVCAGTKWLAILIWRLLIYTYNTSARQWMFPNHAATELTICNIKTAGWLFPALPKMAISGYSQEVCVSI